MTSVLVRWIAPHSPDVLMAVFGVSLLLFQGDHAVTQDALYRDVDEKLLNEFNFFSVQTKITGGKQEYLLRPDLGRLLNDDAKRILNEKCQKNANIQVVVGDGL
ncbi:MAG: ethanolamine ammonia-lyase light chain EutC, partial [Flammeovirgaceae bacterium]